MMVCKTALMLLLVQAAGLAPVATKPAPVATQQQTALSAPGLVASSTEDLEAVVGGARARLVWKALREGRDPCADPALSRQARADLVQTFGGEAVSLVETFKAADGTTKLLVDVGKQQRVEAVLIPQTTRGKPTTTLCVSSQVGCAMGCAFCATGRMGLIRSLSSSEICQQLWLGLRMVQRGNLPPLRSIVFMGMGDAGCNPKHATEAARCLTDPQRFGFSRHRLTLSTVGPTPAAFHALAAAPGQLAWSLHAADAELRKRLVPTACYEPEVLRDGLAEAVEAHRCESSKDRAVMIAVTLLAGVNDQLCHARELAAFVEPLRERVPRLVVDLIPYNPVPGDVFERPGRAAVSAFQQELKRRDPTLFVGVRNARGDDEMAACGQLATSTSKS